MPGCITFPATSTTSTPADAGADGDVPRLTGTDPADGTPAAGTPVGEAPVGDAAPGDAAAATDDGPSELTGTARGREAVSHHSTTARTSTTATPTAMAPRRPGSQRQRGVS